MDSILTFFDETVIEGALAGNGPGNSGDGRLYVLRGTLVRASELINTGMIEEACGQLMSA